MCQYSLTRTGCLSEALRAVQGHRSTVDGETLMFTDCPMITLATIRDTVLVRIFKLFIYLLCCCAIQYACCINKSIKSRPNAKGFMFSLPCLLPLMCLIFKNVWLSSIFCSVTIAFSLVVSPCGYCLASSHDFLLYLSESSVYNNKLCVSPL